MTPTQISADIARGLELRTTIKANTTELKAIEKRLEAAGLEGEQIPLQEAEREGRQFLARCPALGLVIPVVFESDQIVASFLPDSPTHGALLGLAGAELPRFFIQPAKYERVPKDGLEFRKLARACFAERAPEFIAASLLRDKAGIPKSKTVIAWDDARQL